MFEKEVKDIEEFGKIIKKEANQDVETVKKTKMGLKL